MAEQQSGLRFDIFERVHLAEEVDGIENLEEIELVPHIELSTEGQQTVLQGYLRLAGSYTNARNDSQLVELEHRIPVNISMPSERIENIEKLGVEIDHFDVDLLSSRMLNVTGVLYLRGVQAAETRPSKPLETETNEEEMYFVHRAYSQHQPEQFPDMRQSEAAYDSQEESVQFEAQPAESDVRQAEAASEKPLQQAQSQANDQKQVGAEEKSEPMPLPQMPVQFQENVPPSNEQPGSNKPMEPSISSQVQETEEQAAEIQSTEENEPSQALPEMKIAFSGKQSTSNDLMNASELQQSMLQKSAANPALEQSGSSEQNENHRPESKENESSEPSISDRVQWKNLFLPKEEDQSQQFRKVRVCIVQKEETLESIAQKYSLNPREILLYNRLGEQQEVSEGQVIYIPRTS